MINGIPVDDQLGNGALSDWQALIDPLISTTRPQKRTVSKNVKRSTC